MPAFPQVAREEDMSSQIGNDGFYFDLVDFDRVKAFQIADNMTMSRLKVPPALVNYRRTTVSLESLNLVYRILYFLTDLSVRLQGTEITRLLV